MSQMDGMGRSGREVPEGGNIYSRFTSLYSKNEHNIVLNKKKKKKTKLTTGTLNHPLASSYKLEFQETL